MYYSFKNLLLKLPPEAAHSLGLNALSVLHHAGLAGRFFPERPVAEPVKVMGLEFPNRLGLAAGLDKNADHLDVLGALGFGFVEVGTVTPKPQAGNPKPRLFRLPEHQAIINRMGFNNKGVDHLLNRVGRSGYDGITGINIGKNLATPVELALQDYLIGLRKVYTSADYITINISSPNTPGLRTLQYGEELHALLSALVKEKERLCEVTDKTVPLAVKVAPDLGDAEIHSISDVLRENRIDGLIATNTTLSREVVKGHPLEAEQGGLSGAPLTAQSTEVIRCFARHLQEEIPVIGVGGICCAQDALDKLEAGAELVQIYSCFIYKGPDLIREILEVL